MIVRAMKINSGVMFTIQQTEKSKKNSGFNTAASPRRPLVSEKLVSKVVDLYCQEVLKVLQEQNLPTERFIRARLDVRHSSGGAVMELEPWGFGHGTFENPSMGNSGSTPTDGRARMLLAYQAPLTKVELPGEPGTYQWIKDYTV